MGWDGSGWNGGVLVSFQELSFLSTYHTPLLPLFKNVYLLLYGCNVTSMLVRSMLIMLHLLNWSWISPYSGSCLVHTSLVFVVVVVIIVVVVVVVHFKSFLGCHPGSSLLVTSTHLHLIRMTKEKPN